MYSLIKDANLAISASAIIFAIHSSILGKVESLHFVHIIVLLQSYIKTVPDFSQLFIYQSQKQNLWFQLHMYVSLKIFYIVVYNWVQIFLSVPSGNDKENTSIYLENKRRNYSSEYCYLPSSFFLCSTKKFCWKFIWGGESKGLVLLLLLLLDHLKCQWVLTTAWSSYFIS